MKRIVHIALKCRDKETFERSTKFYEEATTAEYVRVLREEAQRTGRPSVAAATAQRLKTN